MKKDNPILALVGMCGSGKSFVTDFLKKKGWKAVYFGGLTIREVKNRGLEVNEANERKVREELRKEHGMEAFAKLSMPDIMSAIETSPTVIDGLYSRNEYKYLKEQLGDKLTVVCIFTSKKIRYERLATREFRPLTNAEAESRDFAEIENLAKGGPIAIADYVIHNDKTEQDLLDNTAKLLELLNI